MVGGRDWTGAQGSHLGAGNVLDLGLGEGYPGVSMRRNPSSCTVKTCVFCCLRKGPCLLVSVQGACTDQHHRHRGQQAEALP